jgi:hypothetical protein
VTPERRLVERAAKGENIREEAARLVAAKTKAKREKSRRLAPRRKPGREAQAAKREAHAGATAQIRAACVKRAGGFGELCGRALDMERAEMCHLDGGSGKRRQGQSVKNCVMEHHECHQGPGGIDKKPTEWIFEVWAWARRYGYPLPERFRKIEALRSPTPGATHDR